MSDKYSIDDILAEVDRKRSGHSEQKPVESVTEIIGGNELDDLMRTSGVKTRMSDSEIREQERAEESAARERAENIRRAAIEYTTGRSAAVRRVFDMIRENSRYTEEVSRIFRLVFEKESGGIPLQTVCRALAVLLGSTGGGAVLTSAIS